MRLLSVIRDIRERKISNDDDEDENDNVKKTIGFLSKTTALYVYHPFSTFFDVH